MLARWVLAVLVTVVASFVALVAGVVSTACIDCSGRSLSTLVGLGAIVIVLAVAALIIRRAIVRRKPWQLMLFVPIIFQFGMLLGSGF